MDCGMKGFQRGIFCPIFQRVEVLRTVEKYLYELRGFKMAETQTQQLTEFDHHFNVGFVRLNFCIKPIISFFIHGHNPFIFRIYLEYF